MSRLDRVIFRIREIAERVAVSEGIELVDVEVHGRGPGTVVRIFLDKPGGITHGDCQTVSRQVGTILDIEDLMDARYTLEVSSPGLERRLVKPEDYQRFAGHKLKLLLRSDRNGQRRFEGRLLGLDEGNVRVEIEGGGVLLVAPGEIEKANLAPEYAKELTRKPPAEKARLR